jgi:hypothetical protein
MEVGSWGVAMLLHYLAGIALAESSVARFIERRWSAGSRPIAGQAAAGPTR